MYKRAVVPRRKRKSCTPDQRHRYGEETDVDPDGSYVSHLDLYRRAMEDVGASTHQFDTFRSLARAGASIEAAMVQTEVPPHVRAFVAHTMKLAQSGSTEAVLAAFFYGREDIIPEMACIKFR